MNESFHRVLLHWADSRRYWLLLGARRPNPTSSLGWGWVGARALVAALLLGLLVAAACRLAVGRWIPELAGPVGAIGGGVALLRAAMVRMAWNQRARLLSARPPGTEAVTGGASLTLGERLLLQPAALLAALAVSVGGVFAVENLRGTLALRRFEAGLRARSLPVTVEEIVPAPVPEAENLALAPLFKPLLDYDRGRPEEGGAVQWRDPAGWTRAQDLLNPEHPKKSFQAFAAERSRKEAEGRPRKEPGVDSPHRADWMDGVPVDLVRWQEYGRSWEEWPKPATPGRPGADVLVALSRWDGELKALRAAAAERPKGRFPLHYDEGFAMILSPLAVVKRATQTLRLRAVALLAEDRPAEALDDLLLGWRLSSAIGDEPILISMLVRVAMEYLLLQPVWEGCRDGRWNEAQLAAIQSRLADFAPLDHARRALNGERVLSGMTYDWMAREPERLSGYWESGGESGLLLYLRMTPRGWVRQNQVNHGRYLVALVDDLSAARCLADLPPQGTRLDECLSKTSPYSILAGLLAPALDNATIKAFEAEAWRRLALAGVALERHRLATGAYPETLSALVPSQLDAVPADPMDGQPLRYARKAEGGFSLYAVGRDRRDDGGLRPERRAKSAFDPARPADLVWR